MKAEEELPLILLLGGTGQIGWELRRTLAPLGRVHAPSRTQLDVTDGAALARSIRELRPALIVNAAAYTAVDQAESARDDAFRLNAEAPGVLAAGAAETGAALVHFSTDYVFDGESALPYREDDATGPLNVYGASKLAGERAILGSGAAALIFRTSWVYGLRGKNFFHTIRRLAAERTELRIVDDQAGAPTWSRAIAVATAQVLARCRTREGFSLPPATGGVYHLTAGGETSWHGFAMAVLRLLRERDPRQPAPPVTAVSSGEFPTPARRPHNSVLDNSRLARDFYLGLPHWEEQLARVTEDVDAALQLCPSPAETPR